RARSSFPTRRSSDLYEASGRQGLVDVELTQLVPGSRVAGPALPVMCGQDDNLMVHACIERISPGDVVVVTMPEPAPVALVGELLDRKSTRLNSSHVK